MFGAVSFFEIMGHDADKLRGFFGELFGWTYEAIPGSDYGLVKTEGLAGGVGGGSASGTAGWTTVYVKVEDVDASAAKAVQLGGRVLLAPMSLPDGMRIAVVSDPEGHAIGLSSAPAK